jgi:hypothetical protein
MGVLYEPTGALSLCLGDLVGDQRESISNQLCLSTTLQSTINESQSQEPRACNGQMQDARSQFVLRFTNQSWTILSIMRKIEPGSRAGCQGCCVSVSGRALSEGEGGVIMTHH